MNYDLLMYFDQLYERIADKLEKKIIEHQIQNLRDDKKWGNTHQHKGM